MHEKIKKKKFQSVFENEKSKRRKYLEVRLAVKTAVETRVVPKRNSLVAVSTAKTALVHNLVVGNYLLNGVARFFTHTASIRNKGTFAEVALRRSVALGVLGLKGIR